MPFGGCAGTVDLGAAGDYTATVTVIDDLLGCTTVSSELSVTVHPPFTVTAALDPACDAVGGGYAAGRTVAWAFSPDSASPATSDQLSGTFAGAALTAYTGTFTASDTKVTQIDVTDE